MGEMSVFRHALKQKVVEILIGGIHFSIASSNISSLDLTRKVDRFVQRRAKQYLLRNKKGIFSLNPFSIANFSLLTRTTRLKSSKI